MKIHIRFGMALDGARWSSEPASVGHLTCGPKGLVGFLETQLGLTGASPSAPDRVNQYKEKIAAANADWCAASFALDAWGTAKQLLSFRDKLVETGWTPEIGGSRRFEALAAIERTPLPLAPALGDRMQAVLKAERKVDADIAFVDDFELYPPLLKKVIEKFFVERRQLPEAEQKGKPSVRVVTAPNEVMLAHDFVRYLVAKPEENKGVAVIAGGDTTLLDELMHRSGLPAFGRSNPSVAREALQILPLWIENMWEPFSPAKFVQLLGVQGSPVPSFIRRELIPALVESPGIGGEGWKAAWQTAQERAATFEKADEALKQAKELKELFEGKRFDPDGDGIPAPELTRRLGILVRYLVPRIAKSDEWKVVIAHINQFIELLKSETSVNRMSVNRMIDTIYGQGLGRANVVGEKSDWAVVSGPGQLLDDADTVLWWDFVDTSKAGEYWSPAEREALTKAGLSTDEDAALKRELLDWKRAYAHAVKRIICFAPETHGGEPVGLHPFSVNLDACREKKGKDDKMIMLDRELFDFETGVWSLEDRSVQLVRKPEFAQRQASLGAAELPENAILPNRLSVTQLTTLIGCPYRWILEKYVGLRESEIAQLPNDNQTLGTLAHKIVEILSGEEERTNRDPELARKRAGELFDMLLPERYADLLLPENADKRVRRREILMAAVEVLFAEIKRNNLQIVKAEKDLEGTFEKVPFIGAADLVLKDASGKDVVYDFKWSYSKKYAQAVKAGLSMQLAFYSWLLSPEGFDVDSCYYLFPRQVFVPNRQDNRVAFERVVDFYRHRIEDLHSGRVDNGYSSKIYPPLSPEEEAEIAALADDPEAQEARMSELRSIRLPVAYPAQCDYCTCRSLCGLAKCVKEPEDGKEELK